jgi:hypothetical protein
MAYKSKRRASVRAKQRSNKRTQKRQRRQRRQRAQRRSQKRQKQMRGGVDTPVFGDDSMVIPTNETHFLDDSDITPPFDESTMENTDYGETTAESISNDSSLGFGGRKQRKQRSRKARRQRAGGFTMTEETSPESYDDDYENNLANMEEVVLSA